MSLTPVPVACDINSIFLFMVLKIYNRKYIVYQFKEENYNKVF